MMADGGVLMKTPTLMAYGVATSEIRGATLGRDGLTVTCAHGYANLTKKRKKKD